MKKVEELKQVEGLLESSNELVEFLKEAEKELAEVNKVASTAAKTIKRWDEIFAFIAPQEKLVKVQQATLQKVSTV